MSLYTIDNTPSERVAGMTFDIGGKKYVATSPESIEILTTVPAGLRHARQFHSMEEEPRLAKRMQMMKDSIKCYPLHLLERFLLGKEHVPVEWMTFTRDFMEFTYARVLERLLITPIEQTVVVSMDSCKTEFDISRPMLNRAEDVSVRVLLTSGTKPLKVCEKNCFVSSLTDELQRQYSVWVFNTEDYDLIRQQYPECVVGLCVRSDYEFDSYVVRVTTDIASRTMPLLGLINSTRPRTTIALPSCDIYGEFNGDKFLVLTEGTSVLCNLSAFVAREILFSQLNRSQDVAIVTIDTGNHTVLRSLSKGHVLREITPLVVMHGTSDSRSNLVVSNGIISGVMFSDLGYAPGWNFKIKRREQKETCLTSNAAVGWAMTRLLSYVHAPVPDTTLLSPEYFLSFFFSDRDAFSAWLHEATFRAKKIFSKLYFALLSYSSTKYTRHWFDIITAYKSWCDSNGHFYDGDDIESWFVPILIDWDNVVLANYQNYCVLTPHFFLFHHIALREKLTTYSMLGRTALRLDLNILDNVPVVYKDCPKISMPHRSIRGWYDQLHTVLCHEDDDDCVVDARLGVLYKPLPKPLPPLLAETLSKGQMAAVTRVRASIPEDCYGQFGVHEDVPEFLEDVQHVKFLGRSFPPVEECSTMQQSDEEYGIEDDPRGIDRGQSDYEDPDSEYWTENYDSDGERRTDLKGFDMMIQPSFIVAMIETHLQEELEQDLKGVRPHDID